jgi:hypothetical protein
VLNLYTKNEIEAKIAELNHYLKHHTPSHYLYTRKKQARGYYVGKLIELEENNLKVISA